MPTPLSVSVIVCAYNEERNLRQLLDALVREAASPQLNLLEILVVASGCTDRTVEIARTSASRDPRIRVLVQAQRKGKASALRLGLSAARGEILVVENADTLPAPGALAATVRPFANPRVGLVCTHPIPAGSPPGISSRLAHHLWAVHDYVSRRTPKAGEAFAVRRIPIPLPEDIEDDDTFIGVYVGRRSPESYYARDAVIYNHAPSNPHDLLQQRLRINRQVLRLKRRTGISTSTWSPGLMATAVVGYLRDHPRELPWIALLFAVEAIVRTTAFVSNMLSSDSLHAWDPVESTKAGINLPLGSDGAE